MNIALKKCTLGDAVSFQRGFDITKKQQTNGIYPVITSSGPTSKHGSFTSREAGVLIGRKGTIGNVFYANGPFWAHDTTLWVKDFKKNHKKFIYYFLKTLRLEQYDVGASNPTLNRNHLHLLPITIPEAGHVQERIVGVLSAYDDLIDVNLRRIAILEEMARRLFEEWFVRFRYPGHEAMPLVETELGLVPKGWGPAKLHDCAEINPEVIKPRNAPSSINYIDISSVSVGRVEEVSAMAFADAPGRARRIVRDGDVIWSTVRPNRRSHALLLDLAPDTIASTGLAVLRARIGDWAWIYEASRTEAFTAFLTGRARGSAYPAVVGDDFGDLPILLPAAPVRLAYQEKAGPMFMAAAKMSAQNTRLRTARDLLLPKLISGEIDVSRPEQRFAEAAE